MFYFKNIPLKRKTYLERHKKTKMEDSRGEIIFSEGHLLSNRRLSRGFLAFTLKIQKNIHIV